MKLVDTKQINSFASMADQANFETLEIPVSEFENALKDTISLYNQLAEIIKDCGIIRGRELGRLTTKAREGIQAARSPCEQLLLVNAFSKQLLARIRPALMDKPQANGIIRQAITKIQLRAEAIIEHIKILAEGREKVSLTSPQARQFLAGREGGPISRRDCIRALKRAEKICPPLVYGHLGDGRATTRLIARTHELLYVSIGNDSLRQRG